MSSESYLLELAYLSIAEYPNSQLWSDIFDQALADWNLARARSLLREAKRARLPASVRADVRHGEGLLALQLGDWDYAEVCLQESLNLRGEQAPGEDRVLVLGDLGMLYRVKGDLVGALDCHRRQLVLAKSLNNPSLVAEAYDQLGLDNSERGELAVAKQQLMQAQTLYLQLSDAEGSAHVLNDLGLVAQRQEDYKSALDFFQRALESLRGLNLLYPAAQVLANIGNIYFELDDLLEAKKFHEQALKTFDVLGVLFDKIAVLNVLGDLSFKREDYAVAASYYRESRTLARELGNQQGERDAWTNLGVVALRQDNWLEAINFYRRALVLSQKMGDQRSYRELLRRLARAELIWGLECLRLATRAQRALRLSIGEALQHIFRAHRYYFGKREMKEAPERSLSQGHHKPNRVPE